MKTLIIASAAIAFLSACNNPVKESPAHSDTTIHADHAPSLNTMQGIMSGMMKRMHSIQPSGNTDIDFAAMMLEHHRGAVQMSGLELRQGKDSAMQGFARKLIEAQDKEIAFMTAFIAGNTRQASRDSAAFWQVLQESMRAMMKTPQVFNRTDADFAAQMIPHHQSAVDMAKAYMQFGKNDSLLKMCRDIISSQSAEIRWLDNWLQLNKP